MLSQARQFALFAVMLILTGCAAPQAPKPLTVFAASSLTGAFNEIGAQFEAQHPGVKVDFNFAGSQQLAVQLEQGAPADVFASADERWMGYASAKGLVRGDPVVFARNRLVVIVPERNTGGIRTLVDLARRGLKLVLAADAVPVGRYSRPPWARVSPIEGRNFVGSSEPVGPPEGTSSNQPDSAAMSSGIPETSPIRTVARTSRTGSSRSPARNSQMWSRPKRLAFSRAASTARWERSTP